MRRMKESSDKRTSIAIDSETKDIFDWSMQKKGSKNVTEHMHLLLQNNHECASWEDLLKKVRYEKLICEIHNLPYTAICVDCDLALCPKCNIKSHLDMKHDVQNFCRIHQVGYHTACLMCEYDRWKEVIDVDEITPEEFKDRLDSDKEIVVFDVRSDKEWIEGHLPMEYNKHREYLHHFPYHYFDLRDTTHEQFQQIRTIVEENQGSSFITISQSKPERDSPAKHCARSYVVGAILKSLLAATDVSCVKGGWAAFHYLYPNIVEEHKSNGKCRICDFYHRP